MLAVGQRPLRLRRSEFRRPPDPADAQADGRWQEVGLADGAGVVAKGLKDVQALPRSARGWARSPRRIPRWKNCICCSKLVRGIGSQNVDFRLRQSDFSADAGQTGAPWLGMKIADIGALDRVLVVGSLPAQGPSAARQRVCARRPSAGTQVNSACHATTMTICCSSSPTRSSCAPQAWPDVAGAGGESAWPRRNGGRCPPRSRASRSARTRTSIAASLASGTNAGILLGNLARAASAGGAVARCSRRSWPGCWARRFGFLGEAANSVGAYLAQAVPGRGRIECRRHVGANRARPICC